jgi:hypothetical protein
VPNICSTYPAFCNAALGYICTITSMAENRADGTMYVTGFTAPRFSETGVLPPEIGKSIFTTPVLAVIPAGASTTVDAHEITGCDLVLPLSLLWTGTGGSEGCAGADLNGNGFVDLHDFSLLAMHWFEMDCHAPDWCEGADLEPQGAPDGEVDMADLAILVNNWLKTGCNNP